MLEMYVWADGTTRFEGDEMPSYMSDDYMVVDGKTTFNEIVLWVGMEAARDVAKEYHGML